MSEPTTQHELCFQHVVLEGTAYEIGRTQGQLLKQNPEYLAFMTSPQADAPPPSVRQAAEMIDCFDRYCPGLNEEIQGMADEVGVPPEQLLYYAFSQQLAGQCSQLAVLPQATADGRMYVGRSYEWGLNDDFRLVTTRVSGRAAHIGFSLLNFGRIDGFNQHGLVVTMSAGSPFAPVQSPGLRFWAVIRTLLDRCASVEEALEVLAATPIAFNLNLLLADRSGQAVLAEIACSQRAFRRVGPSSELGALWATNHYVQPEMLAHDQSRMWQSVARYRAIERTIAAGSPVGKEDIRRVLSQPVPEGVCCHYYQDGLGTLWSAIYDMAAGQVELALGSPRCNPWRSFGLDDPAGVRQYPAVFPLEQPADPAAFYRRLTPGASE